MIQALVLAAVVLTPATTQTLAAPTIDIDKFNTPYSQAAPPGGAHNWYGLTKEQCLFPNRGSNFQVNSNPNQTAVTFTIGDGHQKFESPLPIAWRFTMDYYFDPGSVDLSAVDLFLLDFLTLPPAKLPDELYLYAYDTAFRGGAVGWHIRNNGVYFRKSEFTGSFDWKHIRGLSLRQNFSTLPNPTTYDVYRFYATLKPVAAPPAPR